MGSPKHLWSGEWEDESAAAAARRRAAARPSAEEPTAAEDAPRADRPPAPRRPWWAVVAGVVLVLGIAVGVAVALTGQDSSTSRTVATAPTAQVMPSPQAAPPMTPTTPSPTPTPTTPTPTTPTPTTPTPTTPTVPRTQTSPGGAPTTPGLISPPSNAASAQGSGWLGVEVAASGGVVVVSGIVAGGPADAGNLRPGDVILALDGRSVTTPQDVSATVSRLSPGQTVSVRLRRGPETLVRQVIVGERPSGLLSP